MFNYQLKCKLCNKPEKWVHAAEERLGQILCKKDQRGDKVLRLRPIDADLSSTACPRSFDTCLGG